MVELAAKTPDPPPLRNFGRKKMIFKTKMERSETQWITNWLEKHPNRDEDSARAEWESLSIEIRMYLLAISDK
jgi:hypothetical protein